MNYYRMSFNKYAVFNGRARRKEFWIFFLINETVIFGLGLVSPVLAGLFGLAIIIPHVAVGVRRMHDVNKSGWYFLFPIYNFILACTNGTKGNNEYGEDPLEFISAGGGFNGSKRSEGQKVEQDSSDDGPSVTKQFIDKHFK